MPLEVNFDVSKVTCISYSSIAVTKHHSQGNL